MRTKFRDGLRIISEDGPITFLRESASYGYELIYWAFHDSYSLAIGDTEVAFSAPNRTVVMRTKKRFHSEKPELTDVLKEIERDDVFYDIGANTGLYTLFAAKHCLEGEVVAFEPYRPNTQLLKRDIARNGLENVDTREIALSDTVGTAKFDQPDKADVGYGSGAIDSSGSVSTVTVPTDTGDNLVKKGKIPEPDIIKIDVEGAEPLVIDGLETVLTDSDCRLVYCEVHRRNVEYRPSISDFGVTLSDIKSRFEGYGFRVEELQTRGSEVFLKAQR